MKISIHPSIKGKPSKDFKFPYDGWANIDASIEDIFALITEDGYATSAELIEGGIRGNNRFKSRQLFPVDIDDGMTITDLFANDFYNDYGCGFYASPSFTMEHHKFRILFQTETPITNPEWARLLFIGLIRKFGGDAQCKDSARLFYGNPNCEEIKELRPEVILPDMIVADIIAEELEILEANRVVHEPVHYEAMNDEQKERIVDLLCQVNMRYSGMYADWIKLGWGLKAGGFRLMDFQQITNSISDSKTPDDAQRVWDQGNGSISMGSVIHFLREKGFKDDEIFVRETTLSPEVAKYKARVKKLRQKLKEIG